MLGLELPNIVNVNPLKLTQFSQLRQQKSSMRLRAATHRSIRANPCSFAYQTKALHPFKICHERQCLADWKPNLLHCRCAIAWQQMPLFSPTCRRLSATRTLLSVAWQSGGFYEFAHAWSLRTVKLSCNMRSKSAIILLQQTYTGTKLLNTKTPLTYAKAAYFKNPVALLSSPCKSDFQKQRSNSPNDDWWAKSLSRYFVLSPTFISPHQANFESQDFEKLKTGYAFLQF